MMEQYDSHHSYADNIPHAVILLCDSADNTVCI